LLKDVDPARAGCKYILSQPEHHKKMSFAEEYDLFIQHYQQNIEKNKVIPVLSKVEIRF
jgi:hypothetical protein